MVGRSRPEAINPLRSALGGGEALRHADSRNLRWLPTPSRIRTVTLDLRCCVISRHLEQVDR